MKTPDRDDYVELTSTIDGSVNHVYPDGSEFRCVTRADHPTIYLSSHTWCGLGCTMCHLTAMSGAMTPLAPSTIATRGLRLVSALPRAARTRINIAFMARGDVMAHPHVTDVMEVADIVGRASRADFYKVTLSTVMPRMLLTGTAAGTRLGERMVSMIGRYRPTVYWSAYSPDKDTRRTIIPRGLDPITAVAALAEWQRQTDQLVVVHHALIRGVNDAEHHPRGLIDLIAAAGLHVRVNLVRFNPPPNSDMVEADDASYQTHCRIYADAGFKCRVQPRVGFDVAASCGMFISDQRRALAELTQLTEDMGGYDAK